ncbi:Crinkler (CRN) family protein, partial [Phytophthora palmivora]
MQEYLLLDETRDLKNDAYFGKNFERVEEDIHVLVECPDEPDQYNNKYKPRDLNAPMGYSCEVLDQSTFKRKSRKALAIICLAMEDSQLPLVRSAKDAYDAWSRMEGHFEKKSLA